MLATRTITWRVDDPMGIPTALAQMTPLIGNVLSYSLPDPATWDMVNLPEVALDSGLEVRIMFSPNQSSTTIDYWYIEWETNQDIDTIFACLNSVTIGGLRAFGFGGVPVSIRNSIFEQMRQHHLGQILDVSEIGAIAAQNSQWSMYSEFGSLLFADGPTIAMGVFVETFNNDAIQLMYGNTNGRPNFPSGIAYSWVNEVDSLLAVA